MKVEYHRGRRATEYMSPGDVQALPILCCGMMFCRILNKVIYLVCKWSLIHNGVMSQQAHWKWKIQSVEIIYYNTPCCSNRMLYTFGYLPPELLVSRLLAHCPCSESQMIVLLPLKRPKFKICSQVWHTLVALGRLRHEDCCTCEAGLSCMRKTLSGQRSGCWCWRDTPTGKGTSLSVRESAFSSQHMEAHSL